MAVAVETTVKLQRVTGLKVGDKSVLPLADHAPGCGCRKDGLGTGRPDCGHASEGRGRSPTEGPLPGLKVARRR